MQVVSIFRREKNVFFFAKIPIPKQAEHHLLRHDDTSIDTEKKLFGVIFMHAASMQPTHTHDEEPAKRRKIVCAKIYISSSEDYSRWGLHLCCRADVPQIYIL